MPLFRRSADVPDPSTEPAPFVSALILAAGPSRRMGTAKLALPFEGSPMLRRVAEAAVRSRCRETVVVLGADQDAYRPVLEGIPVRIVENPEFSQGMSTSIRAGVGALSDESEAVVILLADQPRITSEMIDRLIEAYVQEGKRIVASAYQGVVGVPALFDGALYLELLTLEGEGGARSVIETYPQHGIAIALEDGSWEDIDIPEDLARGREATQ
ncbi:MAG TPA: nucleotidyltransferase family protein [bacterium]|jgi:molybdenum cofactor cytidylyltransferase|nr:nucleotidyltransferase family protein [bacterium]